MKLIIRPDLGGRIDRLQDCRTGRDWLWHPAEYKGESRSLPIGTPFDDHWTGGWDEIFPNDAAGAFRGHQLVDHGELWSQSWDVLEASEFRVKLAYQCQTVPVAVQKTIALDEVQPSARIEYRFENQSEATIPFLFKQHCAIAISEGDEILLPDSLIEPVTLDFSTIIGQAKQTRFPHAFAADGQEITVQHIPRRSANLQEFWYTSNLASGICGIRHSASQSSLVMHFDTADFPYVWVFQSYGAWHDHYVVVMEPATTIPYDLDIACQQGTIAELQPGETQFRTLIVGLE
jgi:galactose mutarotase-like enzyme